MKEIIKNFIKWVNTQTNWITIPESMAITYVKYLEYNNEADQSAEEFTEIIKKIDLSDEINCEIGGNFERSMNITMHEAFIFKSLMEQYASSQPVKVRECTCGGYPECICGACNTPQPEKDDWVRLIEDRISELKKSDLEACEKRWDMERPELERRMFRDLSNELTGRRHELENLLKRITKTT